MSPSTVAERLLEGRGSPVWVPGRPLTRWTTQATQGGPLPRERAVLLCVGSCFTVPVGPRLLARELTGIREDRRTKPRTSHKEFSVDLCGVSAWRRTLLFDMQRENILASLLLFQKIFNHTSCFYEKLEEFSSKLLEFPFSFCSLFRRWRQFPVPPRNASPGRENPGKSVEGLSTHRVLRCSRVLLFSATKTRSHIADTHPCVNNSDR